FRNDVPQQQQLANYLKRINGARHLREFIRLNHLQCVVVPQKWLYELPKQFSNPKTKEKAYVLIVEEVDVCKQEETLKRYRDIDIETLRQLCVVVYYFRGLNSNATNLPFTYQNKIAFIDTEKWDEWDRELLLRVIPHMNEDRQEYVKDLFEEFS